jgi:hypothetical protein
MILLSHIIIALASVVYTTYVFFAPSQAKLRGSYAFIAATLLTGTALVLQNPGHLFQACLSGLAYTGAMTIGVFAVHRRLARQES